MKTHQTGVPSNGLYEPANGTITHPSRHGTNRTGNDTTTTNRAQDEVNNCLWKASKHTCFAGQAGGFSR
jgi:hypothetical protein